MLDARYSDAIRAEWATTMAPEARGQIAGFVAGGGGLLALHTAVLCFDDWPAWPDLVGGTWVWGRSGHPPPGEVPVHFDADHHLTAGLGPVTLLDERYDGLDVQPAATVVATSPGAGGKQPMVWVHGRTVTDVLGHDERSLTDPTHAEVLRRAIRWLGAR
jgi:hypothetical protein